MYDDECTTIFTAAFPRMLKRKKGRSLILTTDVLRYELPLRIRLMQKAGFGLFSHHFFSSAEGQKKQTPNLDRLGEGFRVTQFVIPYELNGSQLLIPNLQGSNLNPKTKPKPHPLQVSKRYYKYLLLFKKHFLTKVGGELLANIQTFVKKSQEKRLESTKEWKKLLSFVEKYNSVRSASFILYITHIRDN